jgi:photosystem II stability/assembly factor-like uncharacterized protein
MGRRFALICTLVFAGSGVAAEPPKSPYDAMKYRLVGPYAGGRVSRACGVAGDPTTYYAGTASGGVWKSADGGFTWKPIFDDQPTSSIGSVAVAPSQPNVVYVGSGEANIRGNVANGEGVFKSEDAGKTWKHVWKQRGQIGTITVHPRDANTAYAAVLGHAFGPNRERGIYRTTDGGKTWKQVLFKDEHTGASDVALDPANPRVVFAGFWQARRRPWELTSGGPGSDLLVSRDGGDTWASLKKDAKKHGLPAGDWGRVGVQVSPANSQRVFAVIEAAEGGLFRSDDGGGAWTKVNDSRPLRQRAWYYHTLTLHPTNENVVYAPQVNLLKSIDGGKSFDKVGGPHHGDHHDVWIDPTNPLRMINANDGGVDITLDGGKSWFAPPLPITQFYDVHADTATPYNVMGCMQDLGSARGPSNSLKSGGIAVGDWRAVGGGEAGHVVSDPKDPNVIYAGEYGGILTRYDARTGMARNVTVNQTNPSGIDPAKHSYRFQWTAPVLVSSHAPGAVYHGGNVLFKSPDGGQTWAAISPDLTRNDKQKQQWSGGPITGDNTGAETYCTIFALGESPKMAGLIWAGTDDGKVQVTADDGKTWADVTANVPGLPDWGTVEYVEPSPHDVDTCTMAVDHRRMDDVRPYLWRTTDRGKTWTKISDGLPQDANVNVVREDPAVKGLLYVGTEHGVHVSHDAGKTWAKFQLNLPTVPVVGLQVKNGDLVVGTSGRSVWILDDLTPLREKAAGWAEAAKLAPVRPATMWAGNTGDIRVQSRATTDNPPAGGVLYFTLGKSVTGKVTLDILDAAGKVIAHAEGKAGEAADDAEDKDAPPTKKVRKLAAKPGLNRFVWDFTHDGADPIPGAQVDAGDPAMGVPVTPGTFTARLTAGGKTSEQPVEVKADPRLPAPPPPSQEALALKVRDEITALSAAVKRLRSVKKQLALRKELLKDLPGTDAKKLAEASEAFGKKLDGVEEKLHNPKAKIVYDIFSARGGAMLYSQLTWLLANVTEGVGVPTKAMTDREATLAKELSDGVAALDTLLTTEGKSLNEAAKALGLPELYFGKK